MMTDEINIAAEHFKTILKDQLKRVEMVKSQKEFKAYEKLDRIVIGVCGGDGIGPIITKETSNVMEFLIKKFSNSKKVEFKYIEGLTIENRAKFKKAIPDDVLDEIKSCDVILKGPTTTPRKGDGWPEIESANVAMRKELDLFANVRPIKIKSENIDWVFFRENTEGSYALGSCGVNVTSDLAIDFTVTTKPGSERIARMAFEYARKNNKKKVSIVTKANVIKTTDGNFLCDCRRVAKDYPEIEVDDWYIDIVTAKLIDLKRRSDFSVFVLPNLYGDIVTDEAAQIQGGVGTAGSANIGKNYAMFEAIHGSAPRMVDDGREQYANPSSMLRAAVMLFEHIGFRLEATKLEQALDICCSEKSRVKITGRADGATAAEFGQYVMETVSSL